MGKLFLTSEIQLCIPVRMFSLACYGKSSELRPHHSLPKSHNPLTWRGSVILQRARWKKSQSLALTLNLSCLIVYNIFLNQKLRHSHFLNLELCLRLQKMFGIQIAQAETIKLRFLVSDFKCFYNNFVWVFINTTVEMSHLQQTTPQFRGWSLSDNVLVLSGKPIGFTTFVKAHFAECWKWPLSPWFGNLTVNSERPATPQTASAPASSLHYPAIAWGPITPAALSVSLFPFLLLFHYLSPLLPIPFSFSRFLSLQALFVQCFQELPVSPDWLKQTLTLFWYLIQLCSFSSHRPWSTQSIRCPGSHRAPLCDWS